MPETKPSGTLNAIIIRKYGGQTHEHKKRPPGYAFDALSWVLLARAGNRDFRRPMKLLYSNGSGEFVCTDGHRMHVASIGEYEPIIPEGCWEVVHADPVKMVLGDASGDSFIPYAHLFERAEAAAKTTKRKAVVYRIKDNGNRESHSFIFGIFKTTGRAFNTQYAADAFKGQDSMVVSTEDTDDMTPIYFVSKGSASIPTRRAIVMPLKV